MMRVRRSSPCTRRRSRRAPRRRSVRWRAAGGRGCPCSRRSSASSSSASSMIFCRSRAARRRSCMSRIAVAWISSMSSRSISPVRRVLYGGRPADERDDLVERVERLEVPAQDVGALLGLAQPVCGAPLDDLDLVVDPVRDETVDRQGARHAVDDREHVRAEVVLQLRVLVQVVEHDLRHRVALEHDRPGAARCGSTSRRGCRRCR